MASSVFTFDLNPGETITGSVVSTGTSGSIVFYGCTSGSARVVITNSNYNPIASAVIPYNGGTTITVPFSCNANETHGVIIYWYSGGANNHATGSFTLNI